MPALLFPPQATINEKPVVQSCKTELASEKRVLTVSSLARDLTPAALLLVMQRLLQPNGFQVSLADATRLRMGMVSSSYCYLSFSSHYQAVMAARVLASAEMVAGHPLEVHWADRRDWNRAAPRLPAYF